MCYDIGNRSFYWEAHMGFFDAVDLNAKISNSEYEKILKKKQLKLLRLQQRLRNLKNNSLIIMYEGWDAAGKGGNIGRIVETLDPRGYDVHSISAPNFIELSHDYLWRFSTKLPVKGDFCVFDRSWYGRVLVERVDKLTPEKDWMRAYDEINNFEDYIVANGCILIKFWLHISPEEQLRRFNEREHDPFKNYKITPDDWHNREKWGDYLVAAEDMFERTSPEHRPWYVISAENKKYARISTIDIVINTLNKAMGMDVSVKNDKKD